MSRSVRKVRETKETKVLVELNLDEKGEVKVRTPVPFFNHMLNTMLFYMGISAVVEAEDKQNYDDHLVVEERGDNLRSGVEGSFGRQSWYKEVCTRHRTYGRSFGSGGCRHLWERDGRDRPQG